MDTKTCSRRMTTRTQALAEVTAELAAGVPPTAAELADRYERSDRWARGILAEVRAEVAETPDVPTVSDVEAGGSPVVPTASDVETSGIPEASAPEATETPRSDGRALFWFLLALGAIASVAGNILAVRLGRDPSVSDQVFAALWPVILCVSVEGTARLRNTGGRGRNAVVATMAAIVVGGTMAISYVHLLALFQSHGYGPVAYVAPLVIDAAMMLSTLKLAEAR